MVSPLNPGAAPTARARVRQFLGLRIGMLRMYPPRPLSPPRCGPSSERAAGLPSISIVTPVFNQAEFIGRTLESVRGQGYPKLEHIVMDGGSRDGTQDVIRRFADGLASWTSERDAGQADAINKGLARATGDVLAWLNADDLLLPGALDCVGHAFAADPDLDVIYGDRIVIDAQDREVGRWALPAHSGAILSWFDFVPQETLFWRRRAWERVGAAVDTSFQFAMDWDLLVRLRDSGARFRHLPCYLGAFRVHDAQKTSAQMDSVGALEMHRIRVRCLGHAPGRARQALAAMPYFLRHMAADWRSRWGGAEHPCG